MFTSEEGAWDVIEKAVNKYEKQFLEEFPVYEYTNITTGKGFDFSIKGAVKLSEFIDERIKNNKPVDIPEGYNKRIY